MNKQITFRHMDHSPTLEQYVNQQLARIESFLEHERDPKTIHVVLNAEPTHNHHRAEIKVTSPHYDLFCEYEAPDMHDAIKHVMDTMHRMLTEAKKKNQDSRRS